MLYNIINSPSTYKYITSFLTITPIAGYLYYKLRTNFEVYLFI